MSSTHNLLISSFQRSANLVHLKILCFILVAAYSCFLNGVNIFVGQSYTIDNILFFKRGIHRKINLFAGSFLTTEKLVAFKVIQMLRYKLVCLTRRINQGMSLLDYCLTKETKNGKITRDFEFVSKKI